MGQVESQATRPSEEPSPPVVEPSPPSSAPPPSSLEALAAEAMSFDEDDTEEVKPFLFPLFRCFYTNLPFASLHLGTPSATGQSNNILLVQSIEMKVQKALDCPCVADLKNGPCGGQFVDAFSCFLRSTEEEKDHSMCGPIWQGSSSKKSVCGCGSVTCGGSDCVKPFITLQDCIKANPEAFSKEILEEEENEKEADKSNLKVRAPSWSRESNPKV
ncbi:Cox19-like CHCH family protein [Zea mays]|uniref:Cox19-like CHCH family protein n=1 Tax=Zea mays TaxID=4577 RepID=A0A1D6JAR1_MAIZE|nr:Cox19-like CHCH family protein [Zea mays]